MKLSSYLGAKAISADKQKSGYIVAVNILGDEIEYFLCADENEKEFVVDAKSVISFNKQLVFCDRATVFSKCKKIRLGKPSYSQDGKFLGYLTDFETAGNRIKYAYIGKKRYLLEDICDGDAVIARSNPKLKSDVLKDGKIMFKRGEALTPELLSIAKLNGEYIQTNLKAIE